MDAANIYTSKSYARQPKITLHSGFIENHNYHRSKRFTCIAAIDQESTPSALLGRVRRERGSKEPGMQCSAVTVPFSPACSSCTHPPDPSTAPSTAPRTEHSSVLCVSPARLPGTEGKLNRLPTPRTNYKPLCQTDTTQSISLLPSLNRTVACPSQHTLLLMAAYCTAQVLVLRAGTHTAHVGSEPSPCATLHAYPMTAGRIPFHSASSPHIS